MNSNVKGPFVDPMREIASVLSVSLPCMGSGTDTDEDFCAGEGCGRRLSESEKKVGLCTRCQKLVRNVVPTIFMPTSVLTFMPTSIHPAHMPMMAKKRCPNGDGDRIKHSHFPRGWKCSNPRCEYAKYG